MELTEQEKAWMAGILEGEGYISIFYNRRRNRRSEEKFVTANVVVGNCDPYLIQAISTLWERLGLKFSYEWKKNHLYNKNSQQALLLRINSVGSVAKLLCAVHPYMKTKIKETNIILEYADYRNSIIKLSNEKRGKQIKYKHLMDWNYVDSLIKKCAEVRSKKYDFSKLSRKAGRKLDLTKLRSSEAIRHPSQEDEDMVRSA